MQQPRKKEKIQSKTNPPPIASKISCPSTQSSRHSKQSDATPIVSAVSRITCLSAHAKTLADWKKIRGRVRIKINSPPLPPPRPSNYLGCQPSSRSRSRLLLSKGQGETPTARVFYREAKKQSKHLPPCFERPGWTWKRIPSHGEWTHTRSRASVCTRITYTMERGWRHIEAFNSRDVNPVVTYAIGRLIEGCDTLCGHV